MEQWRATAKGLNSSLSLTAGAAGPRLFTIHQIDANTNNLPKAHTWWVPPVCSRTRSRKSRTPLNRKLVFSLQLQSDRHSALRGLWQAIRQAADGDWGDLWLCGGMRRTEEHSSCLQSSSSLIYALPFTVRSAAAIFIFYSFLLLLFFKDKFKIRHERAEFAFRITRCSIISFPVNSWSRFQFHLASFFFLPCWIRLTPSWTDFVLLNLEHCR